mmetsp:Transcript_12497/g.18935  ORF Transcript_12497/g.18935 Transcript_12497/m.18935 type:complete len:784 (-) Transcript_12497:31-2382(-)
MTNGNNNATPTTTSTATSSVPLHHPYTFISNNAMVPTHPSQSQMKQKNNRFISDNDHIGIRSMNSMNSGGAGILSSSSTNPAAEDSSIQPPPTPAVQHFFSRPSSSSNSQQKILQSRQQTMMNDVSAGAREMHPFHHQASGRPPQQSQSQHNQHNQHRSQITTKPPQPVSLLYPASQHIPGLEKNPSSSASSSSSSLSSVAGVVYQATTGSSPIMHVHQQFQGQPPPQPNQPQRAPTPGSFRNLSPISPAAMCTSEYMMLPPPPRYGTAQSNNSAPTGNQQSQWQPVSQGQQAPTTVNQGNNDQVQNQMSHTSWLQHVNNIAMNTNNIGAPSHIAANVNPSTGAVKQTNGIVNNGMPQPTYFTTSTQDTAQQQQQQHQPPPPQPQQIFISAMPHSNTGTMNPDILPIPPTANAQLSTAALHHHFSSNLGAGTSTAVESKEKRERRLARNRESARQSRRRKKELLINLEAQVNKLNSDIENERRRQLMTMEKELMGAKRHLLQEAFSKFGLGAAGEEIVLEKEGDSELVTMLNSIIRNGGPNIAVRRAAAGFQYNALRQLILPFYQQFFLSMSLKQECFFTGAKEKRSKENKGTGRISSKLVGEEIHKSGKNSKEKSSQTCGVDDADKVWPLICYELTVSLDQEERLLQAFRRIRDNAVMPQNRGKVSVAMTMVSSLQNGILYQSHSAAHRNEVGLLQVLTPDQALRFLHWFALNKDRCTKLFGLHPQKLKTNGTDGLYNKEGVGCPGERGYMKPSDSLNDICKQLTEAMMIAKTEDRESFTSS